MKIDSNPNKQLVEYIKMVYGKKSTLASITDINDRKEVARDKLSISVDHTEEKTRKLIMEFLREENHYKHSLLLSRMELYWETLEVLREPLTATKDEDKRLKNIKLKGDVNDLCGKLEVEIYQMFDSVYGEEFKEEAQKTVTSYEQRLVKAK